MRSKRQAKVFATALDAAAPGVWTWDIRNNLIYWDARCQALFGAGGNHPESLPYTQFFSFLHPEDREETETALRNALSSGFYDMIHRVLWPDGSVHWLRCKGRIDDRDEPRRLTGISLSVDWILQVQNAIRNEERLAATARMADTLAHQINNPLQALGNSLYLMQEAGLDGAIQELLATSRASYDRVAQITRRLLSIYARALHPAVINLAPCLHSCIAELEARASAQRISISLTCDTGLELYGNPNDIRQMMMCLLENAIEHVRAGGRVVVRARLASDWLGFGRTGIRVVVADDGVGIPPGIRSQLLQPFAANASTPPTGLGLWICGCIVARYGGSIRFRSSVVNGRSGTCFAIFLRSHARRGVMVASPPHRASSA
jgi:signal transduction histidine kinase